MSELGFKVEDVMKGEYFGNGYSLYGGPAIFKSFLVGLQKSLDLKPNNNTFLVYNKKEVLKLKNEVLYVPSTTLVDNSAGDIKTQSKE